MSENRRDYKRFIISRTDSIGDVILTLPVAGMLKREFPSCKVIFLGRSYTRAIVEHCEHIDEFLDWDAIIERSAQDQLSDFQSVKADVFIHVFPEKNIARLAKKAAIPIRIGTSHRVYHINTCNKLLNLGRKNSDLHEAQLNLKLLVPLGIESKISEDEMPNLYGFSSNDKWTPDNESSLNKSKPAMAADKFNLIIHPRSKGSAREWGLENYSALLKLLPKEKFNVILTGTKEEGAAVRGKLHEDNPNLIDLSGTTDLAGLINLINGADGLLSASTGPLHIASALGKHAIGLYAPMRPIHPGRWAPLGKRAKFFVLEKKCSDCKSGGQCACIRDISPEEVQKYLLSLVK